MYSRSLPAVGLASLVLTAPCHALDPSRPVDQYSHAAWGMEHGLPQNTVQAIVQARDGFLWLGTAEGLARFDGERFTSYDAADVPALGTADIQFLVEATDASLWIGAYGAGLVRFRGGRFDPVEATGGQDLSGLAAAAADRAGAVWFGGDDGQIYRYGQERLEPVDVGRQLPAIRALLVDAQGRLWIGTTAGLGLRDAAGLRWYDRSDGLASLQVNALAEDASHQLWIGTSEGLFRLAGGLVHDERSLVPDAVRALRFGQAGNLWVGTDTGLVRVRDGRASRRVGAEILTDAQIRAFGGGAEGSLWVGTFAGGLNQLKDGPIVTYTRAHGLVSDGIGTVAASRDGGVWLGLGGGAVQKLKDGRVGRPPLGLGSTEVLALHEDGLGRLWAGTEAGVARLEGGRWRRLGAESGIPEGAAATLMVDRAGDLWVGYDSGGAARISAGRATRLTAGSGLPNDQVRALLSARDGSVLVGTYGGLVRIAGGHSTTYRVTDGLGSNLVRALAEDADGVVWIGTYGGGLSRLQDGRITTVDARRGLLSNVVYAVVDDGQGRLWMSCNRGIFSIRKADFDAVVEGRAARLRSDAYGRSDGMLSVECNGGTPAAARSSDGRIYVATVLGVAVLDPVARPRVTRAPQPRWEQVLVDGRAVATDRLVVPAGARRVRLEFTSPDFLAPERLEYEHRLEGFEEEWSTRPRRSAEYTNLPPGDYSFRVRVTDRAGQHGEITLPVQVMAVWYRTRGFAFAAVAFVAAAAFGAVRLRLGALQASEARLKQRVEAALADIRVLSGLLPICSNCKKIRDDRGYWGQIETYIREHSEAEFTHGICPDCAAKLYPGLKATTPRPASDQS